ncbi:MAG: hypothetical protein KC635_14900 [Myxococcales bacterium]|nr:hypothetical protein [Myxococcales bacterium]MCB9733246.1 hypothetical protein [Deltaproteobacteria bacterium]
MSLLRRVLGLFGAPRPRPPLQRLWRALGRESERARIFALAVAAPRLHVAESADHVTLALEVGRRPGDLAPEHRFRAGADRDRDAAIAAAVVAALRAGDLSVDELVTAEEAELIAAIVAVARRRRGELAPDALLDALAACDVTAPTPLPVVTRAASVERADLEVAALVVWAAVLWSERGVERARDAFARADRALPV